MVGIVSYISQIECEVCIKATQAYECQICTLSHSFVRSDKQQSQMEYNQESILIKILLINSSRYDNSNKQSTELSGYYVDVNFTLWSV